ncbi:MAG: hypothetical protein Q4G34_01105 [Micrococcus sp.]|nr:hypothetical protein [Micrococcus sp.]
MTELEERVADLEKIVLDLSRRVNSPEGATQDIAASGSDREVEDAGEEAWTPVAWCDRASREEWRKLVAWVDWLRGTYDVTEDLEIRECWPAHRGLANELAALRDAWEALHQADHHDEDKQAIIHWHHSWLGPFLTRARTYRIRSCSHARHERVRPPVATNWALVPTPGEIVTAGDADSKSEVAT